MGRRNRKSNGGDDDNNGFAEWGGYMQAKKAKLAEQFNSAAVNVTDDQSSIFKDLAILVNGYTKPSADELRQLMLQHGGTYHLYQNQSGATTHIIASNLPNVKINHLGSVPIVKPDWITDSVTKGRLLDYSNYLLYTSRSRTQPRLNFGSATLTKSKVKDGQNSKGCVSSAFNKMENCYGNTNFGEACDQSALSNDQIKPSLTASDPRFLSEFYSNSRLHLISTLGAEFKQLVNEMREKSVGIFPGKEKLLLTYKKDANSSLPISPMIMHIDMDCFFVSVGLRHKPELRGKPVAVTHSRGGPSRLGVDRQAEVDLYLKRLPEGVTPRLEHVDNRSSLSEIASCSYEARKYGIKNGMFVGTALKLCPELIPIAYDFQGYREVSAILYKTVAQYTLDIEAVSCDEMYVDVTKILEETGLCVDEWATHIRNEIMAITGCPCSTGFGSNRLQARLATKKAKPSGQYFLEAGSVEEYMRDLPLADLPGVGWATLAKLKHIGLITCGNVQEAPVTTLRAELGVKAGETIYDQARGVDRRPLSFEHERKSVSAEVNYGIRFKSNEEALTFIESLATEVHSRLVDTKMKAKCVTLKLMVRAAEAPKETAKFLGHGVCDSLSRSTTTKYLIDDASTIFREVKNLYGRLGVVVEDLRGVGIQLSRLEKAGNAGLGLSKFLNAAKCSAIVVEGAKLDASCSKTTQVQSCVPRLGETVNREVKKEPSSKVSDGKECSGRGRPKGSNNQKKSIAVKPSGGLSDFVRSCKTQANEKQVQSRAQKMDIDMDVLNELPEDLRNEIIKEYNLKDVEGTRVVSPSRQSDTVTEAKENKSDTVKARKKDFADLSHDQLKSLLRNWLRSEDVPRQLDVDMLGSYLKTLALDRAIERLHPLLNFLHRNVTKMNCNWHDAYLGIVDSVQEGMLMRYGCKLQVLIKFECVRHSLLHDALLPTKET